MEEDAEMGEDSTSRVSMRAAGGNDMMLFIGT